AAPASGGHAGARPSLDSGDARGRRQELRRTPGFHLHAAEDRIDAQGVERLERAGVLGPQTLCVHGVHLDDRGIDRLAASGSWLAHCPESNMNNAVGAPLLKRFARSGVRLALGTDGFTAHLPREALAAHLLQSHLAQDPREGWSAVPALLFEANARLATESLGIELGRLRPGAAADVVIWDYRPPTPVTVENLWSHVIFGLSSTLAAEVFVAGRRVLEEGRLPGRDEAELARQCSAAAARLWERF
ncbi:MAG: amidohydrolase family protein, partial [Candidatus Eisenbacteria bacterium]|nr:amidohydrolase family protein [Candidatus Eisenbacteria bacterium]